MSLEWLQYTHCLLTVHLSIKVIDSIRFRIKYHQLSKNCDDLITKINERKDILTYFKWDEENPPENVTHSSEVALQLITLIANSVPFMVDTNSRVERQLLILDFSVRMMENCASAAHNDEVHPVIEKEIIEGIQLVSEQVSRTIKFCELISIAKYIEYICVLLIIL